MNIALKNALKQEFEVIKAKTQKTFNQAKSLSLAVVGWLLMIVATPYLAMNVPEQAPTLFTSLFICGIFMLGCIMTQQGLDGFEKSSKDKNAGELLDGLELGSKEEYSEMLKKTGRSH